jgi:predicted nucleotide-binding protein (sugar kinase/HSP70/actin superfamily)
LNTETPHYKAYVARPFLPSERDDVEILFGGLHWRAERVIQAVFENVGYRARPLPTAARADLLLGRELADVGQCCPTSFVTGNLAQFLRAERSRIGAEAVTKNYVYLTAGACGACRFGQYHQSYDLALRGLGLEPFRIFLMGQTNLSQGSMPGGGLKIDMPFTMGVVWALLCTDVLQSLEYQTRPYELEQGQTDRVVQESVDHLCAVFRARPVVRGQWSVMAWHLLTDYFHKALREIFKKFEAIEVDRLRPKPIVKITGEFYLQTIEGDPNYNIHRWLEQEGAEVYPAPIAVWLDFLIRVHIQKIQEYVGVDPHARYNLAKAHAAQRLLRWAYNRLRRALGNLPHELPDQYELRKLASPYFHHRMSGGEGDMLIGKAVWAHIHKKAHMICELSPYGCMPNTMSIGAMAGVTGKYPNLLYAPIEIKGDAEVHALSRCQMVLTEARARAITEFETALAGRTKQALLAKLENCPKMRKASYRIPHHGWVGTAANLASHLTLESA